MVTLPLTFPATFPDTGDGGGTSAITPIAFIGPASRVVTDNQFVSLHTATGVQVYQWSPDDYSTSTWTRNQRDASRCDLVLPPVQGIDPLTDVAPWLHWITVWDGDRDVVLWTGPIQKAVSNKRTGLTLAVKDHAAYLSRTRNPITKRWDAADPAWIAGELWRAMIDQQGLKARPIVRADPEGDRFDFQVLTDAQMLDQTLGDLVNLGLRWSVVSGAPVIGPLSLEPVATLSEDDFIGEGISLVRDGAATYNDVLVRGPDNLARAHVDYYGQNLQTIANVDNMFGVSNVTRAAQAYVRRMGAVQTRLELTPGTTLHPEAPVSIDDLMPSARFVVQAHGIRQLMELTSVEVERVAGSTNVKVTMDVVEEELELSDKHDQPPVTLGRQANH